MDIEITKIQVLVNFNGGTDIVYVQTTLPTTMPKVTDQPLSLEFEVEAHKGVEYVRKVFKANPEIIRQKA